MPVLDAQADFRRARRAYVAARIGRRLMRQENGIRPSTLAAATMPRGGPARLEVVSLRRIVGTLEPTSDFDACFRPASEAVRYRWERIALAHRQGTALPPIALREQSDGFYVIDGRHRVSVARALADADIEAWVVGARAVLQRSERMPLPDSMYTSTNPGDARSPAGVGRSDHDR